MSTHTLHHIPKATLYHFTGSVWSAVPVLTALEKGFTEVELEQRVVNLFEGANFSPAFLKISPKGTVPVLVAPYEHTVDEGISTKYKAITTTTEICQFLDSSTLGSTSSHPAPSLSPATVQGSSDSRDIIEFLHAPTAPDPNALMLSFRNDEERKAKLAGMAGGFLKGRQAALERYSTEAGDADGRLSAFYELKLKENGGLLSIYEGKEDASSFVKMSTEAWANLPKTLAFIEGKLSSKATYLVGDQISLADLHAGAFFARILAVCGAKTLDVPAAVAALEGQLPGTKVGPKTVAWLEAVFARKSFQEVYHGGLH